MLGIALLVMVENVTLLIASRRGLKLTFEIVAFVRDCGEVEVYYRG